jgi:outer membrane lipoprotein-sorting protein
VRIKAVVLFVPFLFCSSLSAYTWKELKDAVRANSAGITSLEGTVAITMGTPMGSVQSRYKLYYKSPGNLKLISEAHPEFFFLKTKDVTLFKPNPAQATQGMLMASIQMDADGHMFNTLTTVMDVESADGSACGEDFCFGVTKAVGQEVSDSLHIKSGHLDVTGSKDNKRVKTETLTAGPGSSKFEFEYGTYSGLSIPQVISMTSGGMTLVQEFSNLTVNGSVSDGIFKP